MLILHLTVILTLTLTLTLILTLILTLTLSERNAILWRPVNYNLAKYNTIPAPAKVPAMRRNNLHKEAASDAVTPPSNDPEGRAKIREASICPIAIFFQQKLILQ